MYLPVDLRNCKWEHGPRQWDAFRIPQMLESSPEIQRSRLLSLPTEILLQVFSDAGPVDKLCLALTCKRLLHVSAMIPLKIPSAAKHRKRLSLACPAMLGIVRFFKPVDARGRPKKTLALCCDCYRYRPKRQSYWKGVRKNYPTDSSCLAGYMDVVPSWSSGYSFQCPACWCESRIRDWGHLDTPPLAVSSVQGCVKSSK
ncbi:hypothetical protein F5X99DRAFT_383770 [Biscogniauxia marginata]|nr:hypothetical protein F5X99DRAFT_383770 [Biscogniauxia marginata]